MIISNKLDPGQGIRYGFQKSIHVTQVFFTIGGVS